MIECACGCGGQLEPLDKQGRPRKSIIGHQARIEGRRRAASYVFPKTKKCPGCLSVREIEHFRIRTTSKLSGPVKRPCSRCRDCERKIGTDYRRSQTGRAYKKAYDSAHKDDIRYFIQSRISMWRNASGPKSDLTDRKSTRLNSSHMSISYAVFC